MCMLVCGGEGFWAPLGELRWRFVSYTCNAWNSAEADSMQGTSCEGEG